jgi:hypothetical protein
MERSPSLGPGPAPPSPAAPPPSTPESSPPPRPSRLRRPRPRSPPPLLSLPPPPCPAPAAEGSAASVGCRMMATAIEASALRSRSPCSTSTTVTWLAPSRRAKASLSSGVMLTPRFAAVVGVEQRHVFAHAAHDERARTTRATKHRCAHQQNSDSAPHIRMQLQGARHVEHRDWRLYEIGLRRMKPRLIQPKCLSAPTSILTLVSCGSVASARGTSWQREAHAGILARMRRQDRPGGAIMESLQGATAVATRAGSAAPFLSK